MWLFSPSFSLLLLFGASTLVFSVLAADQCKFVRGEVACANGRPVVETRGDRPRVSVGFKDRGTVKFVKDTQVDPVKGSLGTFAAVICDKQVVKHVYFRFDNACGRRNASADFDAAGEFIDKFSIRL